MSGYSGTPLAKKLGIKDAHRGVLIGAPDGFEGTLEPLPDDVVIRYQARGRFDVIVFFVNREAHLRRRFPWGQPLHDLQSARTASCGQPAHRPQFLR